MTNYLNGKNILITGINGFVGGNIAKQLFQLGAKVFGLVRTRTFNSFICYEKVDKKISLVEGELCDLQLLSRIISEEEINIIFHLAAQASVPHSIEHFFQSSQNNLLSGLKVFEWAKDLRIPVVYASSSAVYGDLELGDDKETGYDILTPYAQDKLTLEDYGRMMWKLNNLSSVGLRLFNV